MGSKYLVGQLAADGLELERGGWLLGSFFPTEGVDSDRHVGEIEVKHWQFSPGEEGSHTEKKSGTLEWSLILSGRTRAKLDGSLILLEGGDYVLIRPGVPNNLVHEVLETVTAITIKSPSDPKAKRVLEATSEVV